MCMYTTFTNLAVEIESIMLKVPILLFSFFLRLQFQVYQVFLCDSVIGEKTERIIIEN